MMLVFFLQEKKVRKIIQCILITIFFAYCLCFSKNTDPFFFTRIINHTPYIIITNEEIVNWIDLSLQNKSLSGVVHIDFSNAELIEGLQLYYHGETKDTTRCYKLAFDTPKIALLSNRYVFQIVKKDGSGNQVIIEPLEILYHKKQNYTYVIIKCKALDKDFPRGLFPTSILKDNMPWAEPIPQAGIPENISKRVSAIEKQFYEKKEPIFKFQSMEESIKENGNTDVLAYYLQADKFFAVLVSYGHKGMEGELKILPEKSGRGFSDRKNDYAAIYGITDVNRDGNHELIVRYGSGYGGGQAIISVNNDDNQLKVDLEAKIATTFD